MDLRVNFTSRILKADDDKKEKRKDERKDQVAAEAEIRKQKETVLPQIELTPWQKEQQDLEQVGMTGLGISAEDAAIREKRTDWKRLG